MGTPDGERFVETGVNCLLDMRSTEDVQLLLTEEETWKQFVAGVDLSREEEATLREAPAKIFADPDGENEDEFLRDENERKEEDALSEALGEIVADTDSEDEVELQDALWHKESFLDAYSQVKLELEGCIRKLRTLADKVDKVHRDCTISQVVAGSSSAVSGILTILGLSLAPVTAGVSLALSATGLGLGAAAAVTSVSTSIVEKVNVASAKAEASKLVSTNKDTMEDSKDVLDESGPRLVSLSKNSFTNLKNIKNNIDAIKLTKANPRLANNAKRLMTTGKISARNSKQVQKAFRGTPLAMTKGARIMGAATAGLFLLLDVVSLVQDSKHLHEGAKSECAAELRKQAQDLEQKLEKLKQIHDILIQ
ncbi:apolipoprotein L2-like [Apodemus sylvaticus]|uniref:apolipoprotein L2-like n=1 Tax=Apodemus sylvaticus TaxID=10129 RepID=UPI002242DB95|nr:apolipoprotein L2-like [Apodemus sylvaticus]XP_052016612.1 apolipoprotein L2-like [Apodemus sylvaticus]